MDNPTSYYRRIFLFIIFIAGFLLLINTPAVVVAEKTPDADAIVNEYLTENADKFSPEQKKAIKEVAGEYVKGERTIQEARVDLSGVGIKTKHMIEFYHFYQMKVNEGSAASFNRGNFR